MSETLTTITHLINSPPGQLAAGGVLAGIVWKFFERVESVLTDQTKLEIAVWLLGRRKISPNLERWPEVFTKTFDAVFGTRHLSWRCFYRSVLISFVLNGSAFVYLALHNPRFGRVAHVPRYVFYVSTVLLIASALPDYASLLETRFVLLLMSRTKRGSVRVLLLLTDGMVTVCISVLGIALAQYVSNVVYAPSVAAAVKFIVATVPDTIIPLVPWIIREHSNMDVVIFCSSFFTSIWLWLYAGSGFLLKAARRFDIGFDWFNRQFDIEKKPLQSIGLVAGALVAIVYWAAVIVSRVVG
jgi:hypothetical protein